MQQHTRTFYELVAIIGLATTYVLWNLWHEVLVFTFNGNVSQALVAVIGLVVAMVVLISLIGLTGVLFAPKETILLTFFIWSIPLLQYNSPFILGAIWMIIFIVACLIATWSIHAQSMLFIKPMLIKVIPGQVKVWFLIFSILLSGSLVMHPAIQSSQVQVVIPTNLWDALWQSLGVNLSLDQVQGASRVSFNDFTGNGTISVDSLQQLLQEYGLLQEDSELPSEFTQQSQLDPNSYLNRLETNLSSSVKTQTEELVNNFIDPIRAYLPYIIGISFFLTTQIVTPIMGYIGYFAAEVVLKLLLRIGFVELTEEEKLTQRYVLQ
ncbi:hypothetical protein KC573_01320 [candidate division WWE3 bacterium]|uniref:EF-hand domain-containing protein n=1 Tax=candidate division WWE3 bacterium TaxID=2053526 RepID=A0A955LVK4_UNCKA|nr:hypothetical protein [candidate division WWE3 bacterium]